MTQTIAVDEAALARFKRAVFTRHQSLRGRLAQEASIALVARAEVLEKEAEGERRG